MVTIAEIVKRLEVTTLTVRQLAQGLADVLSPTVDDVAARAGKPGADRGASPAVVAARTPA